MAVEPIDEVNIRSGGLEVEAAEEIKVVETLCMIFGLFMYLFVALAQVAAQVSGARGTPRKRERPIQRGSENFP